MNISKSYILDRLIDIYYKINSTCIIHDKKIEYSDCDDMTFKTESEMIDYLLSEIELSIENILY